MAILLAFLAAMIGGGIWGYWQWNKNLVPIQKYTGEFQRTLFDGHGYLVWKYGFSEFDVMVAINDDNRTDVQGWGWLFKPYILVNENVARLAGWTKDMNLIADIVGLPRIEGSQEAMLFWLFHEYRHILQAKGLAKNFKPLNLNDERVIRGVVAHHRLPKESDADIFALESLVEFRAMKNG